MGTKGVVIDTEGVDPMEENNQQVTNSRCLKCKQNMIIRYFDISKEADSVVDIGEILNEHTTGDMDHMVDIGEILNENTMGDVDHMADINKLVNNTMDILEDKYVEAVAQSNEVDDTQQVVISNYRKMNPKLLKCHEYYEETSARDDIYEHMGGSFIEQGFAIVMSVLNYLCQHPL